MRVNDQIANQGCAVQHLECAVQMACVACTTQDLVFMVHQPTWPSFVKGLANVPLPTQLDTSTCIVCVCNSCISATDMIFKLGS